MSASSSNVSILSSGTTSAAMSKREKFAKLIAEGNDFETSAILAGYAKNEISRLSGSPAVVAAIREARRQLVDTEGASLAYRTLKEVMTDAKQPAASRIRAAEVVLKWSGDIRPEPVHPVQPGDGARALAEMTVDELGTLISKLEQARSVPMIDISPATDNA